MATIRKRSSTSGGTEKTAWICAYTNRDGSRHIETFKTKREAEAFRTRTMHAGRKVTNEAQNSTDDINAFTKTRPRFPLPAPRDMWLACRTQYEIAKAIGYSEGPVSHFLKTIKEFANGT